MKSALVVEDEVAVAELVELVLTQDGYTVEVAHDGRDALERLATKRPSIVITDFMMPFINGNDLVQRIRKMPALSGVPIVMMTAVQRLPAESAALGVVLLKKPFDIDTLLHVVRQAEVHPTRR